MCDLTGQPLGEVDNLDGLEGASPDAHAATNAEILCNFANRRALPDFNADFSGLVDGACLLAG
jgi:hypothetical protein